MRNRESEIEFEFEMSARAKSCTEHGEQRMPTHMGCVMCVCNLHRRAIIRFYFTHLSMLFIITNFLGFLSHTARSSSVHAEYY